MERAGFIVRSIWAACLLVGAANHVRILLRHGLFWDYHGAAWPSALYWSSLTVADPLVAVLLFVRPKAGIVATIFLIATNVAHNLAVTAYHAPAGEFLARAANPFMIAQILFLLFVAATAPLAWRDVARGAG